jgi:hypothetical protein
MQGFYNITQSAQKHPKASHKITFEDLSHLPDKPCPATIQFVFILFSYHQIGAFSSLAGANSPELLKQVTIFMHKKRSAFRSSRQNNECAFSEDCAKFLSQNFLLQLLLSSDWPIRWGLWLLLVLAAGPFGSPVTAAELSGGGRTGPTKDAPPISGNPTPSEQTNAEQMAPSWRLVRSPGSYGEPGTSAILHTVDFERSDPRLAGLMVRCGKQGTEIIIVVVEPFPPRVRPQITLRTAGQQFRFEGSIIPTGAGIRLPNDAAGSLIGPWRSAPELEIKVADGDSRFDGVVPLSGLSAALDSLNAECVQK